MHKAIVESLHLNTMATSYNIHFATYSNVKKQITQLISTIVQKALYNDYVIAYLNSPFHEDTLKDQLQDALKDLKS